MVIDFGKQCNSDDKKWNTMWENCRKLAEYGEKLGLDVFPDPDEDVWEDFGGLSLQVTFKDKTK